MGLLRMRNPMSEGGPRSAAAAASRLVTEAIRGSAGGVLPGDWQVLNKKLKANKGKVAKTKESPTGTTTTTTTTPWKKFVKREHSKV